MEKSFAEVLEAQKRLTDLSYECWVDHCLFTFQWWLLLFILLVPWFIWWKFVNKKRLTEILSYGLLVVITTCLLDEIGSSLNFWGYPYKIVPLIPRLIAVNFTALPVVYMFIYQYFSEWKLFAMASVLMAALFAFIGEPIIIWLDIYRMYHWNHIYSFFIYIIIALFLRWLIQTIVAKQQKNIF